MTAYRFTHLPVATPADVRALRSAAGWDDDTTERWAAVLSTALGVATAWDGDQLVGMGVLSGSVRHAVLCDLVVHPDHRRQGIAGTLVGMRLALAGELGCRYAYVGLSDENPLSERYVAAGITDPAFTGVLASWRAR